MEALKLVLILTKERIDMFNKFSNPKEFEILATTTSAESGKILISKHKNAILVLEDVLAKESLMAIVLKQKMSCLILCETTKDGFDYLAKGATDMMLKSNFVGNYTESSLFNMISCKIKRIPKTMADKENRIVKNVEAKNFKKIVAIGSSTGGAESISQILKTLPKDSPPIVIVQHMPPVFTELYAKQLDNSCKVSVWEARDMDELRPGLVLLAPGDKQMTVEYRDSKYIVRVKAGAKVSGHCPSVDVLFGSIAKNVGDKAIGVILTGMGADGANGLLDMRKHGAYTLGQDQQSSVVYGMPKVAFDIGAVCRQEPLGKMAAAIMSSI